ncbi:four-carbon acid sugar kinase family protein [Salinirubellus sp. GCM10025818]|uniref:four-carbon acid sugar kinase family protein n=1 Tax=Salinirubellus TaxID=2162630 RepID=UPI0030CCF526
MGDLLLAYYGDDFTGSTDVLESLSLNGVPTVLFLETPDAEDLERFGDARAVGIAGTSRGMSPGEMEEALPPAFGALDTLDPEIVQYKVCSTFDSSTEVGSIGRAIDVGQRRFDSPFVPVVVATPSLEPRGRYVAFGNLFATVGGTTYRLDRHPTMRRHPVTPMTEADLTRHLGEQTDRGIGLLDVRRIDGNDGEALSRELEAVVEGNEIVVFDGLDHDHQRKVGRLIWERALDHEGGPLFSASSSGLDYALSRHWRDAGVVPEPDPPRPVEAVDRILVMSGSASPVNRDQIDWALEHGFEGIRLDTPGLLDPDAAPEARGEAVAAALDVLAEGGSPLLYSVRGPDDEAVERTVERAAELGIEETRVGARLGDEQGRITREILDGTPVERVCVAGGDTSGHVAPHLDVFALEFLAPVGAGSPLCRAASRTTAFDGLELALKGGQVQTDHEAADFFGAVRDGGVRP